MFALSVKVIALWGSAGKIRQTLAHVMTGKRTLSFFSFFSLNSLLTNMSSEGPCEMRNICFSTHGDRLRESFTLAQKQSVSSSHPSPTPNPNPPASLLLPHLVESGGVQAALGLSVLPCVLFSADPCRRSSSEWGPGGGRGGMRWWKREGVCAYVRQGGGGGGERGSPLS